MKKMNQLLMIVALFLGSASTFAQESKIESCTGKVQDFKENMFEVVNERFVAKKTAIAELDELISFCRQNIKNQNQVVLDWVLQNCKISFGAITDLSMLCKANALLYVKSLNGEVEKQLEIKPIEFDRKEFKKFKVIDIGHEIKHFKSEQITDKE